MDKQYYKRTRGTWRRSQNGNTRRLAQNNTKKNIKLKSAWPWWNTWLLVQEIHLHSRQTSTRNEQRLTRHASIWLDDQRKDYINPKGPKQRNCSKQLQTHNLLTNDVENTNSTNKGKDLLLANKPRTVPWRTERMPQMIQKHSRITLHRSTHPKWEQDKTEKSCYGLDRLQKAYDMVPQGWILHCLKMYRISHEVINFIEQTMKNWRVELTAGGRSIAETKIQRGIF